MDRRAKRTEEAGGVRLTHALAVLYVVAFLGLVLGKDAPWYGTIVEGLGVSDLTGVALRPWTLVTHLIIHRDPVEAVFAVAILLLVGPPLEDRLGIRRVATVYLGAAVLAALGHATLASLGSAWAPIYTGSLGASAGLLTGYLLVLGSERNLGTAPFPLVYMTAVALLFGLTSGLWLYFEHETRRGLDQAKAEAYTEGQTLSVEERVDRLWTAERAWRLRPDAPAHVLGLAAGGLALVGMAFGARWRERYRMRREIDGLEEEVEARARVEALLEKISKDGLEALSRSERSFLRYASSRFYRSGRLPTVAREE
jgi:membrane associated rhomboid family serine protease